MLFTKKQKDEEDELIGISSKTPDNNISDIDNFDYIDIEMFLHDDYPSTSQPLSLKNNQKMGTEFPK